MEPLPRRGSRGRAARGRGAAHHVDVYWRMAPRKRHLQPLHARVKGHEPGVESKLAKHTSPITPQHHCRGAPGLKRLFCSAIFRVPYVVDGSDHACPQPAIAFVVLNVRGFRFRAVGVPALFGGECEAVFLVAVSATIPATRARTVGDHSVVGGGEARGTPLCPTTCQGRLSWPLPCHWVQRRGPSSW